MDHFFIIVALLRMLEAMLIKFFPIRMYIHVPGSTKIREDTLSVIAIVELR